MFRSKCIREKSSGWEASSELAAPKQLKRYSGYALDSAESFILMENDMRRGEPRMRFEPESDSSPKIVAFKELSRIFRPVRICFWGTWQPLANLAWAILSENSRWMN